MKTNCRLIPRLAALGAAGFLALTASAQPTNNPNNFNDAASRASFVTWWGLNPGGTWDATLDAGNDPNSGSLLYSAPFVGASGEQFMTFFTLANRWGWDSGTVIDGTAYTNFSFDIKVDPSSAITPGGNYGNLECGLVTFYWNPATTNNVWGQIYLNMGNIPLSATNWTRVNRPVNVTAAHLDTVTGFFFKLWSNGAHTNTLTFNIDNVALQKPEVVPVIPPPTVSLTKAVPGLAFVAASAGQYDRQSIRTVGSNYSWIGASGPVSYSVNVAKLADNAHPGLTQFMHFIPGGANPNRSDSDWHEPNVLMWRINNNADGSGWSELNYKTNTPDNNGHLYDTGSLGGVGSGSPLGTWTLTFDQNTNLTITTPDGGTRAVVLPPEVIDIFNQTPGMQVNVGCVPGELSRIGQMSVVTGVKFVGTPIGLDSNFLGVPRDTNVWSIVASSPTLGVQEIPLDAPFWLNWTLPANGFNLQSGEKVAGGTWANPALAGYDANGVHYTLLNQTNLPGANAGFFRMMKRVGTKLLVLLPGETLAPGTPTGKTGTPDGQKSDIEFSITVQLMDKDNYPVSTPNDLINLTATGTPYVTLPPDASLANGSRTMLVTVSGEGTVTLTASNVTNPAITPGSSSVAVTY